MSTGTVKWFNTRKGYGFIQPSNGGKDVFVHITKLEEKGIRHLNEGQLVSYETYDDRGRIAAGSIVLL
ncbi:MAG: cold-shock protein [Alphaproteobacteria bacterium]|mgnify:FL=1|jgi:CspA family cold shock protein|nr:cold-shock protein [Alphaproteobacteria bacterium]